MAGTAQDLRRMEPDVAEDLIQIFADSHGLPTLYFAWHAAFPMVLTPDLLYRLWANFRLDSLGRPLDIPWVAVADLLLSDFVKPIGRETYEMDGTVRDLFLAKLRHQSDPAVNPCFGSYCLDRLSTFLLKYITPQLSSLNPYTVQSGQAQQLASQAYREPETAMAILATQITESITASEFSAQLRLSAIVDMLAGALKDQAGFVELQDYTRERSNLVHGILLPSTEQADKPVTLPFKGITLPPVAANLPPPGPALQAEALLRQASAAIQAGRYADAQSLLGQAGTLAPQNPQLSALGDELKRGWCQALLDQAESDFAEARYSAAQEALAQAASLSPQEARLVELQSLMSDALAGQKVSEWLDFDLQFVKSDALIDIHVASPAGDAVLPNLQMPDGPGWNEFEALRAASGAHAAAPDFLRQWGERLFQAVIWEGCRDIYRKSIEMARSAGKGLRILLDFHAAPALQNLPWEYLFDPQLRQFLILSYRVMLCRYSPGEGSRSVEIPLKPPTRLSVVISSLKNDPGDVMARWKNAKALLTPAMQDRRIDVEEILLQEGRSGLDILRGLVSRSHPHILFFIGDGLPDATSMAAQSSAGDSNQAYDLTSFEQIAAAIRAHLPVFTMFSTGQAEGDLQKNSFDDTLTKVLLSAGVPTLITTTFAASTDANQALLVELCRGLVAGLPVDIALHNARIAMANQKYFEWGNYALFTNQRRMQPLVLERPAVKAAQPASQPIIKPHPGWTLGMDASEWQGEVDWVKIAQDPLGIRFVFLRATDGSSRMDKYFKKNWLSASKAGLLCGAYHFFRFSEDPIKQADFFYKSAGILMKGNLKDNLPPVVDVEPEAFKNVEVRTKKGGTSKPASDPASALRRFLEALEDRTDLRPIIYTATSAWKELTGDSDAFFEYPLWLAQYKTDAPVPPAKNWGGKGWNFWQFTIDYALETGQAAKKFDLNWYQGSLDDLQKWIRESTGRRQMK